MVKPRLIPSSVPRPGAGAGATGGTRARGAQDDDLASALDPARLALERAAIAHAAGHAHHTVSLVSLAIEAAVTAAPFFAHDAGKLSTALLQGMPAPWSTALRPVLTQEIAQTISLLCAFGENAATLFGLVERGDSLVEALATQAPIMAIMTAPDSSDTLGEQLQCGGVHQRLKSAALLRHYERHHAKTVASRLQAIDVAFAEEGIEVPAAIERFGDALTYLALGCWMEPQRMGRSNAFINAAAMLNAVKAQAALLVKDPTGTPGVQAMADIDLLQVALAPDSLVVDPVVIDTNGVTAYLIDVGLAAIAPTAADPDPAGEDDATHALRDVVREKFGAAAGIEVLRAHRRHARTGGGVTVLH